MVRYILVMLVSLLVTPVAFANSVQLSFSESSAEFGFSTGGNYKDTVDFSITGYYNEETDVYLTLDMLTALQGDSSSPWLFSLGAKAFGLLLKQQATEEAEVKSHGYLGVAIAMLVGYQFLTAVPIAIITEFGYSPDILNSGKIQSISQVAANLEIMLSASAIAQIGYRRYRASLESNLYHLDENYKDFEDNIIIGIKLRF